MIHSAHGGDVGYVGDRGKVTSGGGLFSVRFLRQSGGNRVQVFQAVFQERFEKGRFTEGFRIQLMGKLFIRLVDPLG